MPLPIGAPAPLVTAHADVFRDLCEHRCQFHHFQHYLTGLSVLDNQSRTTSTRGVLESADQTHLARFCSEAPWLPEQVHERRVSPPADARGPQADAALIRDATLREPG